jgi:quercetin dioxygenase-like cupin family protein
MPALPTLTTLDRAEFPDDRYVTLMVLIENAAGAPRHVHPGLEMTYILEGEGTLSVDGRPDQAFKSGDCIKIPPGLPHSIQVAGDRPGRALQFLVVEKDMPQVSWL